MCAFLGMGAVLDPNNNRCGFRVWAPHASAVYVTGDFCNWDPTGVRMDKEGNINWAVEVDGVQEGSKYKFIIHNGGNPIWRVDAQARDVITEYSGEQKGIVVAHHVRHDAFRTPRFDDLILYQLHVGSFAGRGDHIDVMCYQDRAWVATCKDLICKLDYIRGLGFNAIALLPLGEFPRHSDQAHMGYAPTNWFAPESDYGTPESVRRFVDEAHARGMAVIFDVVYNHASIDQNYYWEYDGYKHDGGIYFEGGGDSSFGRIPAHWKAEVKDFFLDNARMWLDDYRGDGLRFDAAHFVQCESLQHILYHLRLNENWRDKFFIAEWSGDDRTRWKSVIDEIGFNALWGMSGPYGFREAVRRGAFGGDAVGEMLSVMELEPYRNHWNIIRYYLGSHDQIRDAKSGAEDDHRYPVEKLGGRESWTARAQCRMGWALAVTAPGVPMMFMGCEGHMPGYWWPTPDRNPHEQDHRFDWWKVGDPIGAPMQMFVREANAMKWAHPALRSHSLDVSHQDRDNGVLGFRRWDQNGDVVLVVANFSDREWRNFEYRVRTGVGGVWQEIFNSHAPCYGGYEDSGNYGAMLRCDGEGYVSMRVPKWGVSCFKQIT